MDTFFWCDKRLVLTSAASCETAPIVIVGGGRVRMKIKNKKGFQMQM